MPRKRKFSVVQIAVSPLAAADACNCSYEHVILPAVLAGEIPVYTKGSARRILIEDLVKWVRETWSTQQTRKAVPNG